jgi:glutathione S-transferase
MMTLYHSPMCRSTRLVALVDELGAADHVTVERVRIDREGSGADPRNPHPEGKVPCLVHDDVEIWESTAIALYLTELFPEAGMAIPVGDPQRGRFLSWLAWYGDVLEPLVVMQVAGIEHPTVRLTWRGMDEVAARLRTALAEGEYLCGDSYTAADLIISSTFAWRPELTPDDPGTKAWVQRCLARPATIEAYRRDTEDLAA